MRSDLWKRAGMAKNQSARARGNVKAVRVRRRGNADKRSGRAGRPTPTPSEQDSVQTAQRVDGSLTFPVVGVGASAGGLEAFSQLLLALPAKCGLAIVLIQHLAP